MFNWTSIVVLAGSVHGLLMAMTLLMIRRGNRTANQVFSLLLIVFALTIAIDVVFVGEVLLQHPHFSKINPPLTFLLGPLSYLYVKAMTDRGFRISNKDVLHFIPSFVCLNFKK